MTAVAVAHLVYLLDEAFGNWHALSTCSLDHARTYWLLVPQAATGR